MSRTLIPLLLLAAAAGAQTNLPPAAPVTNAAPVVPQEDLTPFGTADALWLRFQAIGRERQPGTVTNAETYRVWSTERIARENQVADEFIRRYPDDKRRWQAEYKVADNEINLSRMGLPTGPYDDITRRLESILAATNANVNVKGAANLYLVLHGIQKVADGKLKAEEWVKQAAAHWETYPRNPQNPGIISKAAATDRRSGTALVAAMLASGNTNLAPRARLLDENQTLRATVALLDTDEKTARAQLADLAKRDSTNLATKAQTVLAELAAVDKLKETPLPLKFTAVDQREVDLAQMRGKVVLIVFWAGWHIPGHQDLAAIRDLHAKYNDKGLEVIGVSFDQFREPFDKTIADLKLTWPQYFDGLAFKNGLAVPLGVKRPPAYWLVNKKGYLVDPRAKQDLAAKIEKLLAE